MSIIEFVAGLFRHNRKTVEQIMLPLTTIHNELDKLASDAAADAAKAHAAADALRAEAASHIDVSVSANATKATLASVLGVAPRA